MISESMDGGDVDFVMFCENIFDLHIPDDDAKHLASPLGIQEWLVQHLSNQRPTQDAAELLRMLAESQQRPELAEGLGGSWQREQISALVWDIFRKRASPIELHEMLLLPPLQRFGERTRKLGIRDWRKLLPTNASIVLFGVVVVLILLYRRLLG
jgi:hypothetical protein